MKILLFDDDYPDETNLPGDMFAHTRARLYTRAAQVLVLRRSSVDRRLSYEGVEIQDYVTSAGALAHVDAYAPDVVAVHFATEPFISEVSTEITCPIIVWVHGYETISWHRHLYNMTPSDWLPHRVLFRHRRSRERLSRFATLIDRSNAGEPIHFVFVSDWMRHICETDTGRTVRERSIIANPIDVGRFHARPFAHRSRNLLVIRSSRTMKYSPDVTAATIRAVLEREPGAFQCRVFSDGELFDRYFAPLAAISGVTLKRGFLSQEEIVAQHAWGGFFICPTRQDAQGVSMCEAMASGLIVATTPVTAIPEFVSDEMAILSRGAAGLAERIVTLAREPARAAAMSDAAARHVAATLDADVIVARELSLLERYAA